MSLYLSFLIWAFYSCYSTIHLSVVFLVPFPAIILTATVSFHPNEGFVWEQLDRCSQLPVHHSLITVEQGDRSITLCAASQDFKEKPGLHPK